MAMYFLKQYHIWNGKRGTCFFIANEDMNHKQFLSSNIISAFQTPMKGQYQHDIVSSKTPIENMFEKNREPYIFISEISLLQTVNSQLLSPFHLR